MAGGLRVKKDDLLKALRAAKKALGAGWQKKARVYFTYDGTKLNIRFSQISVGMPATGEWEGERVATVGFLDSLLKVPPSSETIAFFDDGGGIGFSNCPDSDSDQTNPKSPEDKRDSREDYCRMLREISPDTHNKMRRMGLLPGMSTEASESAEASQEDKTTDQDLAERKSLSPYLKNPDDAELLQDLKQTAKACGYSPSAFISSGKNFLKWKKHALIDDFGPYPHTIDEAEIWPEMVPDWPDWVGDLVPAGSKWERLYWPDGSITIRLVNPRGLVLAARHIEPEKAED